MGAGFLGFGGFGSGSDLVFSMTCWGRFAVEFFGTVEDRLEAGWLSGFDWVRDFASLPCVFRDLSRFLALVLFLGDFGAAGRA